MEKREYAIARKGLCALLAIRPRSVPDNRSYDQMHKQIQRAMERTQSVLAVITHESDNEGEQGCGCERRPEPRACDCGQRRSRGFPWLWLWTLAPEPRTVDCGSCAQRPEAACGCQKASAAQKVRMQSHQSV